MDTFIAHAIQHYDPSETASYSKGLIPDNKYGFENVGGYPGDFGIDNSISESRH
jgi:hypothetical protein